MLNFTISPLDRSGDLACKVRADLDTKTKPPGSLGRLESLALQLALIQQTPRPHVRSAQVIVFAGDHGVVAESVTPYPQAVTAQMVANFLAGGAAISVLAREFGAGLAVVNAGVVSELPAHADLLDQCVARGTANLRAGPAMSVDDAERCLALGAAAVARFANADVFVFGEMGIGNSTSAAALMHALTGIAASQCVGRGTGVDDAGLARKVDVVAAAVKLYPASVDARMQLARFGGFEIGQMTGAMLAAAARRVMFVVDGFIATAAAALAARIEPAILDYAVFAHVSAESSHRRWLDALGVRALLDLDLRLGEGSGAILALPLLRAACALLEHMATFDSAGVSDRG
ncbi:MAG: nicotinate-nucleotide--dimethylbenzimidazole phosphoribosyltransferase [Pseudomarimonas sp.]